MAHNYTRKEHCCWRNAPHSCAVGKGLFLTAARFRILGDLQHVEYRRSSGEPLADVALLQYGDAQFLHVAASFEGGNGTTVFFRLDFGLNQLRAVTECVFLDIDALIGEDDFLDGHTRESHFLDDQPVVFGH